MPLGLIWHKLSHALQQLSCGYCGIPMAASPVVPSPPQSPLCPSCLNKLSIREEAYALEKIVPPALGTGVEGNTTMAIHAASLYNRRIKQLIYGAKFEGKTHQIPLLTQLLAVYWHTLGQGQDHEGQPLTDLPRGSVWVTAIPPRLDQTLGKNGLPSRLEKDLAKNIGATWKPDLLRWKRQTQAQHTLHRRKERFANVAGSFTVQQPAVAVTPPSALIIIDDITTTGATLREACQTVYRELAVDAEHQAPSNVLGLALTHVPLRFLTSPTQG